MNFTDDYQQEALLAKHPNLLDLPPNKRKDIFILTGRLARLFESIKATEYETEVVQIFNKLVDGISVTEYQTILNDLKNSRIYSQSSYFYKDSMPIIVDTLNYIRLLMDNDIKVSESDIDRNLTIIVRSNLKLLCNAFEILWSNRKEGAIIQNEFMKQIDSSFANFKYPKEKEFDSNHEQKESPLKKRKIL